MATSSSVARLRHAASGRASSPVRFAAALFAALAAACAAPRAERLEPPSPQAGAHVVYVVARAMHTGIAVRAADVPADAWPARRDFPHAEYLEVGWGDREYYQAEDPGVWLAARALLWPTPGVLLFVALDAPVARRFEPGDAVALTVTHEGLARLVARVAASHELDAEGRPVRLATLPGGAGRFYASREAFHLFRTCNVWTADVLREAGVPVVPSITAEGLLAQVRELAEAAER
ncbi:MAG: DUF2459 domain-containing protein [Burkholderiales bacterium]|nr:DUF2459 domain-containing protein [Burkholderiales bacterium]